MNTEDRSADFPYFLKLFLTGIPSEISPGPDSEGVTQGRFF